MPEPGKTRGLQDKSDFIWVIILLVLGSLPLTCRVQIVDHRW